MTPTGNIQRPIGFKPQEISALVNREVVEQHAEEASFLWLLRDDAVRAPNYNLQDIADLDERVEAQGQKQKWGQIYFCQTGYSI